MDDESSDPQAMTAKQVRASPEPHGIAKLHMTGKGLSPADYLAQHGLHDHQARFASAPEAGPKHERGNGEEAAAHKGTAGTTGR